jgi:hypothetical protein
MGTKIKMRIEVNLTEAKERVCKMVNDHCWDVINDLLKEIGDFSDKSNNKSIKDIELTLEMIKKIQKFKVESCDIINNSNSLCEILEITKNDLIKESDDEILSAFFGHKILIK